MTAVIARQPPNYEPGDAEVDSVFYIVAKVDQLRSVTPSVIDVTSDLLAMLGKSKRINIEIEVSAASLFPSSLRHNKCIDRFFFFSLLFPTRNETALGGRL